MGSSAPSGDQATARLAALLESAMDAIISVDDAQRIVLYNRAAERTFGRPAAEVTGQPLSQLIPERFRHGHEASMRRFAATGTSSRRMGGSAIVYGLRANGEEFPLDASISQMDTPEGKLFTVILRDVTDRVEAEREQTRLAARLSGLVDSAMDGIVTVDADQRVILYNRAAERIFGWPALQVVGRRLDMLIPRHLRAAHRGHIGEFGTTGVSTRRMGGSAVLSGLRANGEEFPIDASISQVDTPEGKLFTVILRDITERVRVEEELAAFAAKASSAREEEKARIARELHDDLAQTLAAVRIDANRALGSLQEPQVLAGRLRAIVAMLDDAVASTRRIAADLRPLILDDLGVAAAIEWLAQTFTERHGVPCGLQVEPGIELREPYSTAVFRIVQEALVNVAKHARARNAQVRVAQDGDHVLISVEDDGAGFDLGAARKPASLGLVGLRERARLLHGTVSIQSEPGGGTRLQARIPLPPA